MTDVLFLIGRLVAKGLSVTVSPGADAGSARRYFIEVGYAGNSLHAETTDNLAEALERALSYEPLWSGKRRGRG